MTALGARGSAAIGRAGSALAMIAGVVVLAGWILDQDVLKSLVPGAVQMKPNTAFGLLAAGAGLALSLERAAWKQLVARCLSVTIFALGAATLLEYATGADFGIDELLFKDTTKLFNPVPGRMATFTAAAFVLLGTALWLVGAKAWRGALGLVASACTLMIGLLAALGYLWNASELVTDSWLPPVALNTALALMGLGAGLIAEHLRRTHVPGLDPFSTIDRKLALTFWGMVAVLVLSASFSYRSNVEFANATSWVAHTQKVQMRLGSLGGCMDRAASNQRHYLLTGEPASKKGLLAATAECRTTVEAIIKLVTDNPAQVARASKLRALVSPRADALEQVAQIFESKGLDEARQAPAFQSGLKATLAVALAIEQMQDVEQSLLVARQRDQERDRSIMLLSLLGTLLVAVGIFALLVRGMRREVEHSVRLSEGMQRQKMLLGTVINSVPDIIAYKDTNGVYMGCNEAFAALVGKPAGQVAGQRIEDLFNAAQAQILRASDQVVLEGQKQSVEEVWGTYPDGTKVLLEMLRTPLRDEEGDSVGILAIGRNITQRKKAEQEILRARDLAEEATRTKSAFLANMSHEIRTPMTGVLGMVDLLAQENLTEGQRSCVDAMRSSGRHLLNVINDILDFSRTETGMIELEDLDFSIPEVLEQLQSLVNPLAVERGLDLQFALTPHSPTVVRGDPTRLKQVLLNLATNAVKFTERGMVSVTANQCDSADGSVRFRFEVRDTGPGIAAETLSRLFTPFVQADSSTVRRFGGSGLGLAISKRLVEAMGGTIGATSVPGQGSVFFFELSLSLGNPLQLSRLGALDAAPVQPRRILIAEDVAINRKILQGTLGKQGHQLTFAENGAQAVDLVQQQVFDVVLMDVQMPVMDGVEATQRIRKLGGRFESLPILGLTANVMARERQRYLEAGMNGCLMKPIEWDRLNAALASCVPAASALVNIPAIDSMGMMMGAEEIQSLLQQAIETYSGYCESLSEASTAEEVAAEAHKIKGSAGTLGLSGIAAAAVALEAAADSGKATGELVAALKIALNGTREVVKTPSYAA